MQGSHLQKEEFCLAGMGWKRSQVHRKVITNLWRNDCIFLISFIILSRLLSRHGSHMHSPWFKFDEKKTQVNTHSTLINSRSHDED